jgi:hypothetical protein
VSFPSTQDSFKNPSAGQPLNNPSQSQIIAAIHAALLAIETKVGTDNSAVSTSHDYKIRTLQAALDAIDISDLTIADIKGLQAALDAQSAVGHTHTKGEVGLPNVDNTSDANKPVSAGCDIFLKCRVIDSLDQPFEEPLQSVPMNPHRVNRGLFEAYRWERQEVFGEQLFERQRIHGEGTMK